MNIHHLELFYYVARHGGISEAVRHMPYGIQQPAISSQVLQLEEFLGVTLFHRRPFALTPAGEELYQFTKPFFENLGPMADKLRGGETQHLRIAASEIVLRDHLPALLQEARRSYPKLRVSLREGYHPRVLEWLERQAIDVAVGLLGNGKLPSGIHAQPMLKLPLVLMLPKASKIKSAADLWEQDHIRETLITVPSNQPICRAFQEGLVKHKADWFSGIEVSTIDLVQTYVVNGYGIGVTVGVPKTKYHPQVRILLLDDFPMTIFGVLWQGQRTPVLDTMIKLVDRAAQTLLKGENPRHALSSETPPPQEATAD
jgi:DNA-binding transcriptional LysR family regulator